MKTEWVISSLRDLPTLPPLGLAIKEQALGQAFSLEALLKGVREDPVSSILVLREANAPRYRRSGRVEGLRDAALILGLDGLRALLLSVPLLETKQLAAPPAGLDLLRFWNHCRAVSWLAGVLCERVSPLDAETAQLAGLFHDLGKLVIAFHLAPAGPRAPGRQGGERLAALQQEAVEWGLDHAHLAASLFRRWSLPRVYQEAAARHHAGFESAPPGASPVCRAVYLANRLSYSLGHGCQPLEAPPVGAWDFSLVGLTLEEGRRSTEQWRQGLERLERFPLASLEAGDRMAAAERATRELGRLALAGSAAPPAEDNLSPGAASGLLHSLALLAACRHPQEALRLAGEFLIRSLRFRRVRFRQAAGESSPATELAASRTPEGGTHWLIAEEAGEGAGASASGPAPADEPGGLRLRLAFGLEVAGLPPITLHLWDEEGEEGLPPSLEGDREILVPALLRVCRAALEGSGSAEGCREELARVTLDKEQLRAEARRRQELSRSSEEILRKAPLGLFSIDATGCLTSANPAFLALAELADAEDYRVVNLLHLPSVTRCGLDRELLISLQTGKPFELTDLYYVARSGKDYVLRVQMLPQGREGNGAHGLIGIVEDVTLRKKLEQNLIQIERLRALGEMAGSVAHDFNNLLGAILGNVQLLMLAGGDPAVLRRLEVIEQLTNQGAEKVKRLQEFTRIRRDRSFERVDIEPILQQAIELVESRAQSQGAVVSLIRDRRRLPAILGNAGELREAFLNILINALDAMPEGGKLTAKTETDRASVAVTFRDTGCGMSPEVQQRLFEPFFTTKGMQGSGLGMSMVYGIATRHKGEILVWSAEGAGTSMTLRFPVEAAPAPGEPPPAAEEEAAAPRGRILVIDDEEEMRAALADILRIGNHQVVTVGDGETGLEMFRRGIFDLVISDLRMPGISGRDVLRQIKRERPATGTILITGWGLELDPAELAETGVDRLIRKPFQLKEVLNLITESLRGLPRR